MTVGNNENGGSNAQCHSKHSDIIGKYRIVFECDSVKGQYVHIRLNGAEQLSLCEVAVHALKRESKIYFLSFFLQENR